MFKTLKGIYLKIQFYNFKWGPAIINPEYRLPTVMAIDVLRIIEDIYHCSRLVGSENKK